MICVLTFLICIYSCSRCKRVGGRGQLVLGHYRGSIAGSHVLCGDRRALWDPEAFGHEQVQGLGVSTLNLLFLEFGKYVLLLLPEFVIVFLNPGIALRVTYQYSFFFSSYRIVAYSSPKEAADAISTLHRTSLANRSLNIRYYKPAEGSAN